MYKGPSRYRKNSACEPLNYFKNYVCMWKMNVRKWKIILKEWSDLYTSSFQQSEVHWHRRFERQPLFWASKCSILFKYQIHRRRTLLYYTTRAWAMFLCCSRTAIRENGTIGIPDANIHETCNGPMEWYSDGRVAQTVWKYVNASVSVHDQIWRKLIWIRNHFTLHCRLENFDVSADKWRVLCIDNLWLMVSIVNCVYK